jgi:hypothetical protein
MKSNDCKTIDLLHRTRQVADGILARLDLLLHVNISPADHGALTRTVSQCLEALKTGTATCEEESTADS